MQAPTTAAQQASLFDTVLFETKNSFEDLPRVLQELTDNVGQLRVQVFLGDAVSPSAFIKAASGATHQFRQLLRTESAVAGEITGVVGRKRRVEVNGKFLAIRHPEHHIIWIVISHTDSVFEDGPLRHYLYSVRPRLTTPILRSSQIEELFRDIASSPAITGLRLRQVGSRTLIKSKGAKKSVESDRRWTDISASEAFDEARELGHWVTDATGNFRWRNTGNGSLKITRFGKLTFRNVVQPLFLTVVNAVSQMGLDRYRFLENRERSRKTKFRSRPFNIDFQYPVLRSTDQMKLLRRVLEDIPAVTCSVIHGNPYFHAAMVDYRDGSSYEILVIADSRVTIIPQGRSTVGALQRLCARVFSNFREGNLTEAASG